MQKPKIGSEIAAVGTATTIIIFIIRFNAKTYCSLDH